jgi:cytochrome P450
MRKRVYSWEGEADRVVGRHPCTGMKVAKLEMKLIVALFLVGYAYELVDDSGKFPVPFPQPDRNDISEVCMWGSVPEPRRLP